MRSARVLRSSCAYGLELCPSSMMVLAPSRSSSRPSPWCGCAATSESCDCVVRFSRAVGFSLGDRTDSASEKQAGNSSFRKFVGGPCFAHQSVSYSDCASPVPTLLMTYNFNNPSPFALERSFDALKYLSKAFHFGLMVSGRSYGWMKSSYKGRYDSQKLGTIRVPPGVSLDANREFCQNKGSAWM
jgi:hypothetical protein